MLDIQKVCGSHKKLDLGQMKELARALACNLRPADIVLLKGELGAGKTSFAKALISSLLAEDKSVISPTFNIVQIYEVESGIVGLLGSGSDSAHPSKSAKSKQIWHFDLYRLRENDEGALEEIGMYEALQHISIIEWPERAEDFLTQIDRSSNRLINIEIAFSKSDDYRDLSISTSSSV